MKLTVVCGSPREEGSSTKIMERFIEGAVDGGCDVVQYNVNDMILEGCKACMSCKAGGRCIVEDDFREYMEDMEASDALLVTAPNYFSQICGPMITFMNRHYYLIKGDQTTALAPGKKVFGIFAQGAPAAMSYNTTYDWYMNVFERLGFVKEDYLTVCGDSDLADDGELAMRAYRIGRTLGENV